MISVIFSRVVILLAGTLYPAYRSYKAVKTKDTKEYVKWMMYWIVFALFSVCESVADFIISFWFPFYYELKIVFVMWLINPWTKGASILYRKWIHPLILEHEEDIDTFIEQAKTESYKQVFNLGSRGLMCAREIVATAALRGIMAQQESMGARSYSMDDVSTRKLTALKTTSTVRVVEEQDFDEADEQRHEEEQVRTWTGIYDDHGRIIEHSVTKIAEEDMVVIEDPSSAAATNAPSGERRQPARRRSRSRAAAAARDALDDELAPPPTVDSNTLPRRSSRRSTTNSESAAHNSK